MKYLFDNFTVALDNFIIEAIRKGFGHKDIEECLLNNVNNKDIYHTVGKKITDPLEGHCDALNHAMIKVMSEKDRYTYLKYYIAKHLKTYF